MADEKATVQTMRARPAVARPPATATMTPREVFGVLRRYMVLIIGLTIFGLIVGGVGCWLLRTYLPKYTARTYIEVLLPVQTDPMVISTPLVQKEIRYGHRLSIANLIKQQRTLEELLMREKVTETKWFKSIGDLPRHVRYLEKYLGAFAHRDADYVEVSMTCRDAQEAADILNEMVGMFISSQRSTKEAEVNARLITLQERQNSVEGELRAAETELESVRKAYQFTDLERPTDNYMKHTVTLKLDQLELQKTDLELVIKQLEADVQVFDQLAKGPINVQIEHIIEIDPVMTSLAQQLAFSDARLASILSKFGENHREVRQLRELKDEITVRREMRAEEIGQQTRQANLANAKDTLIVYKERFAELERLRQDAAAKQRELDTARIQYEQRVKIRDERVMMLDEIKESIEKVRIIHDDPETSKVRGLGDALKPLRMVLSREWWLWFPGGTVLGLLFSTGLAFLLELADDKVRTPRAVSRYLHIPLLGVVPDASVDRDVRGVDLCRVVSQAPYSLISESYRQCRTNLKLSGSGESLKSLLVTSGSPGDGKTCVAVNLATAFVAENKKVLLIDSNFRQPTSEKLFPKSDAGGLDDEGLSVGFGLSSVLVGQCSAQQAIRSSGIEGLDIIDAGLLPPNPAELLGSARMEEMLKQQRNNYDYIVLDSPPVLLISDAKVLAKRVDATIVVLNAAATHRGAAQRTIRELQDVDANVIGCVLLGALALKGGYFQEQSKSYRRYQEKMQFAGTPA
jgi:capsular exopolysaccharide synthesis family protein